MRRLVSNGNKFLLIWDNTIKPCSSTSQVASEVTSSATTWRGGWVTDNFSTYYLDENMCKI
jgi:hypothetical protein